MPGRRPRYTKAEARTAIAASLSWAESLRRLGMCPTGGGHAVLKKYARLWGISTDHFDSWAANRAALRREPRPLDEILVENSTYSRNHLKDRLYAAGLKQPLCELCGQGELWYGRRLGLVLDHINGVRNDHRLENLRILCPNCAATLDTHCGRKLRHERPERSCERCGKSFRPRYRRHRFCSRTCGSRWPRGVAPRPNTRRVERPPYVQLLGEVAAIGYCATGRRYGVSDNAIRKWITQYERERAFETKERAA